MRAAMAAHTDARAARDDGSVLAKDLSRDSLDGGNCAAPLVAHPDQIAGHRYRGGPGRRLSWHGARMCGGVVWWMPSTLPGASVLAGRRGCRMGRSRGESRDLCGGWTRQRAAGR